MVRAWLGEGLRLRVIGCRRPAAPADARPAVPVRPGEFKVHGPKDLRNQGAIRTTVT